MLDVFIGDKHRNGEFWQLMDKVLKLTLTQGKPFRDDVHVVVEQSQSSVGGTIGAVVAGFLFGGAAKVVDVVLAGVAFYFVDSDGGGTLRTDALK